MGTISVSAEAIWFANHFKATNDIRYYLLGIQIKKHPVKGAFVVGCDGCSLGVYYDDKATYDHTEDSIIFELSRDADKYLKPKARFAMDRTVQIDGDRAKVMAGAMELFVQPGKCLVEAEYPNWRRVMPDISKLKIGTTAAFNALLLERCMKAEKGKAGDWPTISVFRTEDEKGIDHNAGMAVSFGSMKNAFAYFMPLKNGDHEVLSDAKHAFGFLN